MSAPLNHEDLQKLRGFVDFVGSNPTILNLPQLDFVKKFVEKFGGQVPAGEFKMPSTGGKCPFGGDAKSEGKPAAAEPEEEDDSIEIETESEPESEYELDVEGVIEPDIIADQPMGDSNKTPTDEEVDQAGELRAQAAAAYGEQKFEEAINFYTKAIELNPGNALYHAKRGQAYLKLQKPNACIRDCDKALELNCDSAAAYKFRGRAHRLLGNWELSVKDLRQACKLDFDEETDEWLREVTPNAKKIEQHRIKCERRVAERKIKQREKAARKARQSHAKTSSGGPSGFSGGFPGGFSGGAPGGASGGFPFAMPGDLNIGDMLSKMKDPEVAAAVQDILNNPNNINKYASNPKILELLKDVFPHVNPGAKDAEASGAAGENSAGKDTDTDPNTGTGAETAGTEGDANKKGRFVDDGLD